VISLIKANYLLEREIVCVNKVERVENEKLYKCIKIGVLFNL